MMKAESFLLVTTTSPVRVVVRPWEEGKLRRGGGGGGDLEGFSVRYRGTVSSSVGSQGAGGQGTYNPGVHVPHLTPRGYTLLPSPGKREEEGSGEKTQAPSSFSLTSPCNPAPNPVTPPLTALSPLTIQSVVHGPAAWAAPRGLLELEKPRPHPELLDQNPHFDRFPW